MSRFEVFENEADASKDRIPYLIDVQNDLLSGLRTRVVVPLGRPELMAHHTIGRLTPRLEIDGEPVVMLTPELAGVPISVLGRRITDLSDERTAILDALDFLVTGV